MALTRRAILTAATALVGGAGGLAVAGALRGGGPRRRPVEPWAPAPRPLPEGFLRGVNFAHQHRRGAGYGSERAAQELDTLRSLGIRDLALNPFAYTPSLASADIRWGGDPTLTDDDLRRQVEQAQARGMRVLMKPHLWSGSFWAGSGNPDIELDAAGWGRWFEAWTAYVVHHARLAQETGCGALCVGLELTGATVENPGAWAAVARACRQEFKGPVYYSANWYDEYARFTDWGAFDCIGLSAYFPLVGDTVGELQASWDAHFDAIAAVAAGRPVIFLEAGCRAVAGATERPWEARDGEADADLQGRAYEALLRAGSARSWLRGVYWWKWFTAPEPDTDAFVPGPRAQEVLRAWFR